MAIEWFNWPVTPGLDPNPLEIDPVAGSAYVHPVLQQVVFPYHEERPAIFRVRPGYVAGVRPGMAVFDCWLSWTFDYLLSVYDTQGNLIGQRDVDPIIYNERDTAAVPLDFSAGYDIGRVELDLQIPSYYHTTRNLTGDNWEGVVTLTDERETNAYNSPVLFDVGYNLDGQDPRQPFWTNFVKTREVSA